MTEPVGPNTEIALIFSLTDQSGDPLPPHRLDLTPVIRIGAYRDVLGGPDMDEAKATAELTFRQCVAGPVNNWLRMEDHIIKAMLPNFGLKVGKAFEIVAVELEMSDKP